jgi:ABC-type multidrug transport system ATPase subunit
VISMNSDMNLLIMDEPFAGLDEEGEAIVFDLMREKTETGKSVYVITHSPTLDSLYANKIEFSKLNGNTLILN